jgi:hypothetical protein
MRVNASFDLQGAKFNTVKNLKNNVQKGKIIVFTGKPTSPEVSDVVKIANKVSKENLLKYLKELAGPETEGRGVGQPGIEKAKEYIAGKFNEFGLKPVKELGLNNYYQEFEMPKYPVRSMRKGPYIYGQLMRYGNYEKAKTSNVLGMIKGTEKPDEYIIISGHYDHLGKDMKNNIIFPGANDDASGTVTMIEIARLLSEGKPPKKSVIFAALTGEESGWLGANQLSKELVAKGLAKQVEVLNIEMLAANSGNKLDIWDQKMPEIQGVINNIVKAGKELGVKTKVHHEVDPGSDAIRFSTYGIPAASIVWDFDWANHPTYHCAEDTPENINPKIFYEAARVAAGASYLIANDTTPKLATLETEESKLRTQELQAYRQHALNTRQPL